jgi:hypothetical protein
MMQQHVHSIEAMLLFWLFLLYLLGLEYYLLVIVDQDQVQYLYPLLQKGVVALLRYGPFLRVLSLVTFAGLFWMMSSGQVTTASRSEKSLAGTLLLLLFISSAAVYLVFKATDFSASTIFWLYPFSLFASVFTIALLLKQLKLGTNTRKEKSESRRSENEDSIHIRTKKGWINVVNPFRGTLVIGSSGSGKSESIGHAFLHQFVQKGYSGLFYDFKFPTLASEVNTALHQNKPGADLRYFIINFQDPRFSHRCNPLSAENIPTMAHAEEYAQAVVNNLDTSTIRQRDFFSSSAIAWLAALIWFFRSEYPQYCSLPHVINAALHPDYKQVISMLETNPQSADMARSIATAIENKAEKQIAGVIASLQILVSKINSPEICWVLTGDDLDMQINDPAAPKLLCLGSDPGLVNTFSPVISLIMTVALKQMNRQGRQKSFVLLDEAPTLYIPRFEMIPATARSNKVASVFMAQDYAQMVDMYGKDKSEVIIANLSNQFYGKVSSVQTAKTVSEMIGKEEQLITNFSKGSSRSSKGGHQLSSNTSTSQQERYIIRPQEVMQLRPGEFVGQTVESSLPYFHARTRLSKSRQSLLQAFSSFEDESSLQKILQANFERVRREVGEVVKVYPNSGQS